MYYLFFLSERILNNSKKKKIKTNKIKTNLLASIKIQTNYKFKYIILLYGLYLYSNYYLKNLISVLKENNKKKT